MRDLVMLRFWIPLWIFAFAAFAEARPIGRLAAIGDSLTDEYFEETYDYAQSWTEIVVGELAVDMGPLPSPIAVGGSWGEPRRTGFEDNWARYGSTIDLAITEGQHTGAADGAANRGVTHVVIFLGQGDFDPQELPFLFIYLGTWNQSQIDGWIAGRMANLEIILDALAPTGARTVLLSVGDFTAFFAYRAVFTSPAGNARVSAAIGGMGAAMRQLAIERGLVFVDTYAFSHAVYGTHDIPETELLVGNVAIDLEAADTPSGDNPLAAFVDDEVHPNTIPQGVFADLVVEALNVYQGGVASLSEAEILGLVGVDYGGSDTLEAELGPLAGYVENYWSLFIDGFESGDIDAWDFAVP